MKEIDIKDITRTVARMSIEANFFLPADVLDSLHKALADEESDGGKEVLEQLLQNASIAETEGIPLCQDCGLTVVFLEVGQDVHIVGGDLYAAIDEGVRQGYKDGYLRKSIAEPPIFDRPNTKDNTPAVIYTDVVPGENLKITIVPKGGGSENMSALGMLTPAVGEKGVVDFVVRAVEEAGSNPCPPVIVGVGIGGTADRAMLLAKKALLRPVGQPNSDPRFAELEKEILTGVNNLGIGPQGFGGRVTALAVHIETTGAHIASLPVGVNIQCHAARHKEAVL
ncbi:MAG: fumarate hydratase [Chloroflexi bacterium]|nr:fumarate hydratase [Chloroflexota bacterium]